MIMRPRLGPPVGGGNVVIELGPVTLEGQLTVPPGARGIVVFAHGSGSGRFSPRNQAVARHMENAGLATLLFDLLTAEEEVVDRQTAQMRFDVPMLAERVMAVTDWLEGQRHARGLRVGYFGASTGAAAALIAAAQRPRVGAVVSRGGRPDLAGPMLDRVEAPTLLIVGSNDPTVLQLNREALAAIRAADKRLEVVPGASHLFEEPGTLEKVAELGAEWLTERLRNADFGLRNPVNPQSEIRNPK